MSVITFASSKGGAGKTTSAIVLATTLVQRYRVCVIDADPAGRLMAWSRKNKLPWGLDVRASLNERQIWSDITQARQDHDHVVIDLEGAATRLNARILGESDLVIVPMGDEQPDAEAAIETLAQIQLEAGQLNRSIPVRILFARTKAAVKSRLAKSLNQQVRDKIGAFATELHDRTAFSSLHSFGGTLYDMDETQVTGAQKAIGNAELFAQEVESVLSWIQDLREQDQPKKKLRMGVKHGA